MCGIIGIVSKDKFNVKTDLLNSLRRLEYRGYDSSGFAANDGSFIKSVGQIQNLIDETDNELFANVAIAHTRWATHGGVSEINSHPHFNYDKTLFVVHNGIIENFEGLKEDLEMDEYRFITQTDTEVIPHFIDKQIKEGKTPLQALSDFTKKAQGTYAILVMIKGDDNIYAAKKDSPLALGIADNKLILGSDIYAFSDKTNKAIFFDDGDMAVISKEGYQFYDNNENKVEKSINEFEWAKAEAENIDYDHYMIKEIKEQPLVSRRLIDSLANFQNKNMKQLAEMIKLSNRIYFLAAGTSYHASLIGVYLLNKLGIDARTVIASEFENYLFIDNKTLIIPISQSGETMDVVAVLKEARRKGAKIASIVNVPFSTIQRYSDMSTETLAGQEVCVAATKTFTNQLIVLFALAKELGYGIDLDNIPKRIQQTIDSNEQKAKELSKELAEKKDIFILGKGATYPMSREVALKLKEIDYIHAEGMMAGELKHGTIALIEEGVPVIGLVPNKNLSMLSSLKEVEARGAKIIMISNTDGDFIVPKSCDAEFAIYSGIVGHLLSYYIALELGNNPDKPRNLAKSVTVK